MRERLHFEWKKAEDNWYLIGLYPGEEEYTIFKMVKYQKEQIFKAKQNIMSNCTKK